MDNFPMKRSILFLCFFLLTITLTQSCTIKPKLTKSTLDKSIEACCIYLANSQNDEGNFIYEQNFITNEIKNDDNQVRQAGALWGLAIAYKYLPDLVPSYTVKNGLDFYYRNLKIISDTIAIPIYKGESSGSTGSLALIILAHIELLTADHNRTEHAKLQSKLDGLMKQLMNLRREDGQFYSRYSYTTGKGIGNPSPYYDGEALLALSRAAKYCRYEHLIPQIVESAEVMYKVNVEQALAEDPDSKTTKGFYQWGSMSFYQMYTAGWGLSDTWAERTIDMAYWMIDVHKTLKRRKNTAYAYEGISVAYQLAKLTGNNNAEIKFKKVIDKGLTKLTSWQVSGPIPNRYLRANTNADSKGHGGIMNSKNDPWIRIDVVQHQLHALILARSFLYGDTDS